MVLKGYTSELHSKVEELVAAEVKAMAKGSKDLPKSLKSAWKSFQKGDLAKGIASAEKVALKGGDDTQAASDLAADFRAQASARADRGSTPSSPPATSTSGTRCA